jgi:predicted nucleotidyltransferase
MVARPRLPPETHEFIRRGRDVLHLSEADLAVLFDVSPQRVRQILAGMVRVKIDGHWVLRKRGHLD